MPTATTPLDRRRSLDAQPIVNLGIATERKPDGCVDLVLRSPRKPGLFARFMPPILEKRFKLDELGTFVFDQIDGTRSVLEIIEAFIARFKLNRREAEVSVAAFIRQMTERKLVTIVVK